MALDIRTRNPSIRAASDPRPTPRDHWDRQEGNVNEHPTVRYNEMRRIWLGWWSLISNTLHNFAVHRNLFSSVCVRILTFCAYCISDSYSAIHTVHYTNPQPKSLPPHKCSVIATREDSSTYLLTCCFQHFSADFWPLLCSDIEG